MFYYIVCITICVLISSGYSRSIRSTTNEPERCCWSKQLTADATTTVTLKLYNDTIQKIKGLYTLVYDGNRGLIGLKGGSKTVSTEETTLSWDIQSINDKRIYTIDETSKKCSISPMFDSPIECIPDSATYVNSGTSGTGEKKVITDTWLIENDGVIVYTTVTRDGRCIPIKGEMFVPETGMNSTQILTNFVTEIKDESILDIPKQCLL